MQGAEGAHGTSVFASHTPHKDNIISAKLKLDELFLRWVTQGDTLHTIKAMVLDARAHPDMGIKKSVLSSSQTASLPGSPPSSRRSPPANTPSPSKLKSSQDDTEHKPHHPRNLFSEEVVERDRKIPRVDIHLPSFYTPKPLPSPVIPAARHEADLQKIHQVFPVGPTLVAFPSVDSLLRDMWGSLPSLMYRLIYAQISNNAKASENQREAMLRFYVGSLASCTCPEALLVHILRQGSRDYLIPSDFRPFMRVLLDTHPGLDFLRATPEFQERYTETVIVRIFFHMNRRIKGRLTVEEMQKARFVEALCLLDVEADINKHLVYFSYEHFYVIYCKFWELDSDHDLVIGFADLVRYGHGSLTQCMCERVMMCPQLPRDADAVRLLGGAKAMQSDRLRMTYQDFVYFMLAEEDKCSEASQEFWFQCLDVDCDGVLSLYEMEYFYTEQEERMAAVPMEAPPFVDILCQMLDMLKPDGTTRGKKRLVDEQRGIPMGPGSVANTLSSGLTPGTAHGAPLISLRDIRRQDPKLVSYFFNALFNLSKFIAFETKDPFQSMEPDAQDAARVPGIGDPDTEWCRFAESEYDRAVTEENNDGSPRDNDMYY
eukprot:TRINITY_DN6113_c0_g1_i3.p1 TRINITY_DN6113_c0_g1~~TRINITY_DN6113_c0_g1_i3.p1  ORF type:complete len:601 (-),score=145.46 TRINITY_DN6113_c0_g1_i3:42-1844(-)